MGPSELICSLATNSIPPDHIKKDNIKVPVPAKEKAIAPTGHAKPVTNTPSPVKAPVSLASGLTASSSDPVALMTAGGSPDGGPTFNAIYVNGYDPLKIDNIALIKLFSHYGKVTNVKIKLGGSSRKSLCLVLISFLFD